MPLIDVVQESKSDVSGTPGNARRVASRWLGIAAVVAVLVVYFFLSNRPAVKLEGWGHDFEAARGQASASGRAMLVAFESNDCPPCVLMDKTVLSADIIRGAIKNFVPVRVDAFNHRDLMKHYDIDGTPTYAVIDPDGRLVSQVVGYRSVEDFLRFLKTAQESLVMERVAAKPTNETPSSTPLHEHRPVPVAP